MRPFRFAVGATGAASRGAWAEKARRAEALGYDVFVMPDHVMRQFAPVPALMAVADATARIRIGSFVFANDYRNPVMLAKEAATVDVLSGGRLEFGIGAGWRTPDYEQLGIAYERPGLRIERMVEAVRLLKRLFAEDRVDFEGAHYRLRGARVWPRPLQRPHPPFMIGGGGPRILGIAAREADIVALLPQVDARGRHRPMDITARATAAKVARVRKAAGERFERLELNLIVLDADVGSVAAQAKRLGARILASPYVLYGSARQIAEDLLRRRERLGISYYTIPDRSMETFAPVIAELRGR